MRRIGDYAGVDKGSRKPILRLRDRLTRLARYWGPICICVPMVGLLVAGGTKFGFLSGSKVHWVCPDGEYGNPGKVGNFSPTKITRISVRTGDKLGWENPAEPGFNPASFSALTSGSFSSAGSGNQTITPVPVIQSRLSSSCICTPAAWRANSICSENNWHSRHPFSGYIPTSVILPLTSWIASNCASDQGLAAVCVLRAMISSFWTLLIPPSAANIKIVNRVSATNDQNNIFSPNRLVFAGLSSSSNETPTATPIVAKTYADTNIHFAESKFNIQNSYDIWPTVVVCVAGCVQLAFLIIYAIRRGRRR